MHDGTPAHAMAAGHEPCIPCSEAAALSRRFCELSFRLGDQSFSTSTSDFESLDEAFFAWTTTFAVPTSPRPHGVVFAIEALGLDETMVRLKRRTLEPPNWNSTDGLHEWSSPGAIAPAHMARSTSGMAGGRRCGPSGFVLPPSWKQAINDNPRLRNLRQSRRRLSQPPPPRTDA